MLILEDWRKEWERISFDASIFSVDSSSFRLDNGMYLFSVPPGRIHFKANARMHLHWPWLWLQWLLYHICYSSFSNANDDTIYHQDRWEQKVKLAANGIAIAFAFAMECMDGWCHGWAHKSRPIYVIVVVVANRFSRDDRCIPINVSQNRWPRRETLDHWS